MSCYDICYMRLYEYGPVEILISNSYMSYICLFLCATVNCKTNSNIWFYSTKRSYVLTIIQMCYLHVTETR